MVKDKSKSKEHCNKQDCVFYKSCESDYVQQFICGGEKKLYAVNISSYVDSDELKKIFREIDEANAYKLTKLGAQYDLSKDKYSEDQHRLLLKYKAQEFIRNANGLSTPEKIKKKIEMIMSGYADGILLHSAHAKQVRTVEVEVIDEKTGKKTMVEKKVGARTRDPNKPKIADIAIQAIKDKCSFEEAKKRVLEARPESGFSTASWAWYKNKLAKGEIG